MKTKGKVLAVAVIIGFFTVGAARSSFAVGGWPYPGHTMRPDLEQIAPAAADKTAALKKGEGAVKEESGPQSTTVKAPETKPAPGASDEK